MMKHVCKRLIWAFIAVFLLPGSVRAATALIPVGTVVGLELRNNTVTIAAFDENSQAKKAGLAIGDRLMKVDGKTITCAEDLRQILDRSDGTVEVTVQRGARLSTVQISPEITRDGPKLGLYLKQGVTGIGTVTFYDPETGRFGTLGHGVNDPSGQLLQLTGGNAYPARIASVRKGKAGEPGQLVGSLTAKDPIGTLSGNTPQGVFGQTEIPFSGRPLPVGDPGSIRQGKATILSTVAGDRPQEYSVEILRIYAASRTGGRNMLIKVTDPALLEITGGIVQGMSGSPIIQDGKLVGAVTHVLVNDPTTGYGIFIENMLDAAA